MWNENHLQNAGRSIARGMKNAVNAASEGRLLDATESAAEGTATAGQEVGKSFAQATTNLVRGPEENDD